MLKATLVVSVAALSGNAFADVLQYGDQNMCNTGTYPDDPTAGATLQGLSAGVTTFGTNSYGHAFPFSPEPGDYPGTDQIYVGSVQTGAHDGYSNSSQRINGPQVITMDYSSLVSAGAAQSLTLGIMTDDFQFPRFGQPFTASINGTVNTALTAALNSLDETGPVLRFMSIGLDVSTLGPSNVLTLTIDEGGDGGDGWAIDFLTIGVTSVPSPGVLALACVGAVAFARRQR